MSAQAASVDATPLPADSAAALATPLATADAAAARADRADASRAAIVPLPAFAFFYGAHVPVAALSTFASVVVEPDSDFDPHAADTPHTAWLAYVSVGEVSTTRAYFDAIPKAWLNGENRAWGSLVVDQAAPQWPAFYVDHVIAPLWERGFRGFFLDTLDSYQIVAKTDAERARQQAGVVAVIDAIKARYPSARLMLNRGFELLSRVHELVYAVAFESLYRGWNQAQQRYTEVSPADRAWLMLQVETAKAYGLPVVSIDYCPPADAACAHDTAARIRAAGVIPYVTGPALDVVGIGAFAKRLRAPAFAWRDAAPAAREAVGWSGAYAAGPVQHVHMEADRAS
ncbi:endo alpha-1,4 polygalactosaminidase [Burkholderia sp. MR1-5-21]